MLLTCNSDRCIYMLRCHAALLAFVGRMKDLQQKTSGFIINSVCQDLYVKSQSMNSLHFITDGRYQGCGSHEIDHLKRMLRKHVM